MCRQIVLAGLAAAVLLSGCLVRKEEPVAQQKSVGRILDAAFQGRKGLEDVATYVGRVRFKVVDTLRVGSLREDFLRELVGSLVRGGSKAINAFKKAGIRKVIDNYLETSGEISKRLADKIEALPQSVKSELNVKFEVPEADYVDAAAFLKKHTDIGNDRIFARLVVQQGKNLDDLAEAVAINHRLAGAVGAELATDSSFYGLKGLNLSAEQIAAELKISSVDFNLKEVLFTVSTKNPTDGYKFLQELSGVDVYDEAHVLDLLLRRGNDGKFAYEALSAEEIKKLGPLFDKHFAKQVIRGRGSEHLHEFYKTD